MEFSAKQIAEYIQELLLAMKTQLCILLLK